MIGHLNDIFVVLADVNVLGPRVHRQSQLLLGNCPLDPLTEKFLVEMYENDKDVPHVEKK